MTTMVPVGMYARDLQHLPPDELVQDFPAGLVAHPPRWSWRALLPSVGYGRCYLCRAPWWATSPHSVRWNFNGQFALCERCWDGATIQQRTQAHAWVTACWTSNQWDAWPLIETAVRIEGREAEVLGEKLGQERATLLAEGALLILGEAALHELAATLPRDRGTWQDRHVHQVVIRLRYQLDLTFDQVDVDHGHAGGVEIAGSDDLLTGPATVVTWDGCHDQGVAALFFSPYAGWLLQPVAADRAGLGPLIPRGGELAPRPSEVVDELVIMLASGEVSWPL